MPVSPFFRALATGMFAIGAVASAQQTITVGPTGSYPTIQQGVNAANSGDTVLVQPGTYQENITITAKAITLSSTACSAAVPPTGCNAQTTIDGNNQGSVITVTNVFSLNTAVSGFTLINGRSGSSGSSAGVTLQTSGAVISNDSLSANSVAIAVNNGAIQAIGNQIIDTVPNGAQCTGANGIYLTGTNTLVLDSQGNVAATTILGNTISASNKCTGGVGIIDQQGTDIRIGFNQISGQSLGINTFPSSGKTYIYDNLITGGTTGALSIIHATTTPASGPADIFILNNTFANNLSGAKALSGAAGPAELAISGTFSQVEAVNNIFSTSSATNPVIDCAGTPSSSSHQITPIILDHNLFYNSATNGKLGTNGCPVPVGSFGNINSNPTFVSATNFQPGAGSPAIDAGNNSFSTILPYATDIAASTRVLQYYPNSNPLFPPGPVVDIGAYEDVPASGAGNAANFSRISATASSYFLTAGNTVTINANLSNTTNGVQFSPIAMGTLVLSGSSTGPFILGTDANGNASFPVTLSTPGLYSFVVTCSGKTGAYYGATSIVLYVYVANPLAVPTIGLTSSKNPSLFGQSVTFTVTSTATDGSFPSPVVLADNGTTLATLTTSSGSATYTTSTLTQGGHPLTATFSGDATHTSGSSSLTQMVGNFTTTNTTLSSSVNPSIVNQSVTLTAHVSSASGVPTGTVTFTDGATQLGASVPVDASGNATYATTAFALGSHSLTAIYTATGAYAGGSGTLTQVVNADPTNAVLTVSPQNPSFGTTLTLAAMITAPSPATGVPAGAVTFTDGGAAVGTGTLSNGGVATLQIATLTAGAHTLGCTYSGGGNDAGTTCNTVAINITQASTSVSVTSSANPSPALTPITFTVTPSSGGQTLAPGAAVTLTITPTGGSASTYSLTTGASGAATYTSTGLASGTYAVSAAYSATTNYAAGSGTLTETVAVNATSTTLSATPNPGIQNNTETFTATVAALAGAGVPTGTVTFFDGVSALTTATVTATGTTANATMQTSALAPGQHSITAVYNPAVPSFGTSSSTILLLTITPQDFSIVSNPASITIATEHHASLQLMLTPIGGFSAPVSLTCAVNLTPFLTCELPVGTTLSGSGNASVNLTLDTDAILNFVSSTKAPTGFGGRSARGIALAALLPLGLLGLVRRRSRTLRQLRAGFSLVLFAAIAVSLGGCSGKYPGHTPPGTYLVAVTATGTAPNSTTAVTHTVMITLNVTQ